MLIFAMSGLSQRFARAGYALPKYMLPLGSCYVFDAAVAGLLHAFRSEGIALAYRAETQTREFVASRLNDLGTRDIRCVELDSPTRGQAETIFHASKALGIAPGEPLRIFNIDTFNFDHTRSRFLDAGDGYLETFIGGGQNWSYVLPHATEAHLVNTVREKMQISNLCCSGFYSFTQYRDFCEAYSIALAEYEIGGAQSELYVAPLFQHMINNGRSIFYDVIPKESLIHCGLPQEYEAILREPALVGEIEYNVRRVQTGR